MDSLQWQVGDVRITRIAENEISMPLSGLIPEATPDALAPHHEWLQPHFIDEKGRCRLSVHALLIESDGRRILVDTCVGEHRLEGFEAFDPADSGFLDRLARAGAPRDQVDVVLCTHMHFDHVGWNTMKQGDAWVPTFPNARYLFARAEWEHWQTTEDTVFAPTLDHAVAPIFDAGLAECVEMDHRIDGAVRLEGTPGHTPGHVSVRIESGGQRALITGDATHHPVQWAEPDWKMLADDDSDLAAATRMRLIEEHRDSDLLVIGTHYPTPCAGRIVGHGTGARFESE